MSSSTTTVASAATQAATATTPAPPSAGMSIEQRFASERQSRPSGPTLVRAERVLDAFSSLGAKLREQRQHLGAPFGARYCVGAQTGEDIHLSVCEYESDELGRAGADGSKTAFANVENRSVHRNGATTLTMRVGKKAPRDEALAKKLVEAFAAMKPST